MKAQPPASQVTARLFLLGDARRTDPAAALARALSKRGVARSAMRQLSRVPRSALQAVDREIAAVADEFLDVDLGQMLVSGWRKYTRLTSAARRTMAAPDSSEVVVLATHRVVSTHRPSVDVFVDDAKVMTLQFELVVVFELHGIGAVVRLGKLTALRSGQCVITATFAVEGVELLRRHGTLDPAVVVGLDPPVPLLRNPPTQPDHTPPTASTSPSSPASLPQPAWLPAHEGRRRRHLRRRHRPA